MAGFVPPGSTVLEFGCGAGLLRDHLPSDCQYIPSDVVVREGAIVIDLNASTLDLPKHDVSFLSGVFEYVHDIPRAARAMISAGAKHLIASYTPSETGTDDERAARLRSGFVADYDRDTFVRLVTSAGWRLEIEETWENESLRRRQLVFVFVS